MKFVSKESSTTDTMKTLGDKLGVKETKQPEEVKTKEVAAPVKSIWKDGVTTTLVNLRANASIKSESLMQIKGGEVIKINVSKDFDGFRHVKIGKKEGFIKSEYLKTI